MCIAYFIQKNSVYREISRNIWLSSTGRGDEEDLSTWPRERPQGPPSWPQVVLNFYEEGVAKVTTGIFLS